MTNDFIKTQQEFGRSAARQCNEKPVDEKIEDCFAMTFEELDTFIQQVITNTGERLAQDVENINISTKIAFIKPEDQKGYRQAQTDIKQHITSVTGVE